MSIKWIIFDMCGVLIEDAYQHIFREVSKEKGYDHLTFMDEIREPLDKTMQGIISERDFFQIILKRFDLNFTIKELEEKLIAGFVKIEDTWKVVENLKDKGYKLAILSDMGKEMVEKEMNTLELRKYFDELIFSSETGYKKPQLELFKIALEKLNSKPEECIFIDDKKRNTDAAKKLHINTITFETPEKLEEKLKNIKIL